MSKLDPDALRAAVDAFDKAYVYLDVNQEEAVAAAINAFLDAADAESRARLEEFMAGLDTFKAKLEKLRQAIEGEAPWGGAA